MGYASKSPWLIHYDGSSCNGCDIEVLDSLMPLYDLERFGIINTGNPKHADIFLVTGSVNHQNINVVKHIYEQMMEPKVVVACGICACTGGVFRDCYNIIGGVDKAIPVDVYAPVAQCAPRPSSTPCSRPLRFWTRRRSAWRRARTRRRSASRCPKRRTPRLTSAMLLLRLRRRPEKLRPSSPRLRPSRRTSRRRGCTPPSM